MEKSVVQRNKQAYMTEEEIMFNNEKETHIQQENQKKYEKFQMKNLGGFTKIFPIEIPKNLQESEEEEDRLKLQDLQRKKDLYETVRSHARDLFDNQFGVRVVRRPPEPKPETPITNQFNMQQPNQGYDDYP